jgi:hypothetical protein
MHIADRHHFDVALDLTQRESALTRAALRLFPGHALR